MEAFGRGQTTFKRPSCISAVTPSSRPISSRILPSLNSQDRRAGEVHLSAGSCGQRPGQKITERWTGMRAATFPLTDDIVTLRDQVGRAPEVEVRERPAEVALERLNVRAATARFVERIFQQHFRCGQFIHDGEIADLTPKVGEPPANDGLVVLFLAHSDALSCGVWKSVTSVGDGEND